MRVTIVAARFDDTAEEEPEMYIAPEKIAPSVVGKGLDAIIPEKTKSSPIKPINQIGLFEQEDKFSIAMSDISRNGYSVDKLIEVPSYKRYGVELKNISDLEESLIERISLNDLYQVLSAEELID